MADTTDQGDPATKVALAKAVLAKAEADARKSGADADTAEIGVRTARLKAALGDVPSAPFSGAVQVADGAALAEQNLLVRASMKTLASAICGKLPAVAEATRIYLSVAEAAPSTGPAQSFRFHADVVTRALNDAIRLSSDLSDDAEADHAPHDHKSIFGTLAAAGLVLQGVTSLISFARTDYSVSGRALEVGDRVLLNAVAAELLARKISLRLDGVVPAIGDATRGALLEELAELSALASQARRLSAQHASAIKRLTPGKPVPPATVATDPDVGGEIPLHESAQKALDAATALFDALSNALLAEADGVVALQHVAEARELEAFLQSEGAMLVLIKLDGTFGSAVSTKNILSGLGGSIPYKISTLAAASWWCFEGRSLTLLGSGLEQAHTAFKEVDKVGER